MSEPIISTPSTTADIAAQVIADSGDSAAPSAEPVQAVPESPTTETPGAAGTTDPDDFGAIPSHETMSNGYKRENRIPHSRVKSIIDKALAKERAEWEGKVADHTTKLQVYEQERQAMAAVEQMMQTNPEVFLQTLSQINPAYGRYLGAQAGANVAQVDAAASMPQPDIALGDGSKTYSMEGLQKLLDWQAAQVEQRVTQRYQPLEQTMGQWQEAQRQQTIQASANKAVQDLLNEAASWPLFGPVDPSGKMNEVQEAVLKELQTNPNISFHAAYQKVALPRLQASRDQIRQEVLKEINATPRSTSAPIASTAPTTSQSGPRTTADIAAEIIRNTR
jgi:hypothetical protein